jgi:small subunit ribosomal protein S20
MPFQRLFGPKPALKSPGQGPAAGVDLPDLRQYKTAKWRQVRPAAAVLLAPPSRGFLTGPELAENTEFLSDVARDIRTRHQPVRLPASRCRRILSMANTTSAKKATRKIARRTIVNKSRRTRMRNSVRLVELAIEKGDREAALVALKSAEPELMRAAQRNIVHKNNASRKVSRLAHQIAKLAK